MYEIGYFIPVGADEIKDWKEKLEREIRKIDEIIEEHNLPYVFEDNVEATGVAQFIKEKMGETEIIIEISIEPIASARARS
jgi:ABC-type Zn uptake system ZnuABC Zn-binding protein ZnuA